MKKRKLDPIRLLGLPIARKEMNADKLKAETIMRKATIDPKAINSEERRVSILISTEDAVRGYDYYSDQHYDEVLLHGDENIDLSRAGTAKLRYMHGMGKYGELPIGRLENVRIEDKQLRADAVFSTANPDADMLWRMVEEGSLTEISVGGKKQEVRVTERDGDVALVEVVRWEFQEASLVDIGADKNAGIGRSKNQNEGEMMNKIEELKRQLAALKKGDDDAAIARKEKELSDEIARVQADNDALKVDLKAAKEATAELQRRADINALAAKHDTLVADEDVQRFLGDTAKTADDFARALLAKKSEGQGDISFKRGQENAAAEIKRAVADSLVMRAGFTVEDPHADASKFAGATMTDLIRAVTGYDGYDKEEMVKRAMSTDDFPVLLGNVANRTLSIAYSEATSTFELWTTAVEVPDFREMTEVGRNKLGGRLRKITEGGEKKNKETGESKEKWRIYSYGEEISLTREMIINDDLQAFIDVIQDFGDMAKRTANGIVYDLLQGKGDYASYKMDDGSAIFVTARKNTGSGAALDTSALSVGRKSMRRQKSAAGSALNIAPKYLLVSPERETVAGQLINSEADMNGDHSGVSNPFKNALQPIVDAELDEAPWYMVAERRTIKVGYLSGTNRMPIVKEKSRTLSGVTFECVFDFGVVVEDFRGLYKNTGV